MRNLGSITAAAVTLADGLAGRFLAVIDPAEEARDAERAILRRLVLGAALALSVVPVAMTALVSPAIALPAGFALILALFLVASALAIACSRASRSERPEAAPFASDRTILDACAGLVLVLDPQGHVTATGGRDRARYLETIRQPAGRGLIEQIHVSDRLGFLQALDRLRQGEPAASVDFRIERPAVGTDGEQFAYMRADLSPLGETNGQPGAILAQLRDIADERQLSSESRQKAAEAEDANHAKTRFLAAVSHELRTPLNAILGFSDILAGEYFGALANDRQREYVSLIRSSGHHLLQVVNTMLDMSKIEAGRYELMMEPFDAAEAIRSCEEMLMLQAREKGVTLTSRVSRGIGEITADRRALKQVLINLIGNAIKFTDKGGVVSVDATVLGRDLRVSVSDTGIGIPEDRLATLGQPFVQVQNDYTRRYEGTGLGLALVKGLVALHGGAFAIASQPGEGTVITITLPADGSGQAPQHDGLWDKTVGFPPRLKSATSQTEFSAESHDEVRTNDHAKAKIA